MKKVILLFLVFGALGTILYRLDKKGYFDLQEISVNVEKHKGQQYFVDFLTKDLQHKLKVFEGIPLWKIKLAEVQSFIIASEWAQEVILIRKWPQQLNIHIKPKKVILLHLDSKGKMYPLMSDGKFFKKEISQNLFPSLIPDVPILRGAIFTENDEIRSMAIQLMNEIPDQGSLSSSQISEIFYHAKEGLAFTLLKNGIKVIMGKDRWSIKAQRVQRVLDYLKAHEFEPQVIDANLTKKVLVKLK